MMNQGIVFFDYFEIVFIYPFHLIAKRAFIGLIKKIQVTINNLFIIKVVKPLNSL